MSGPAKYSFWSRYLEVFDEVVVLARTRPCEPEVNFQQRADGPGVFFRSLPDHTGPWQYLHQRRRAHDVARLAIAECDAYILRVPGLIGQMVWSELTSLKKIYALELVGDPWDAFSPGTWSNILRPVFRRMATQQLERICAGAAAIHYVTSEALQRRYPPAKDAYSAGFSDAVLEGARMTEGVLERKHTRFHELPWREPRSLNSFRIGFIGSFARLYKGPDVLLRAASICRRDGLNFRLTMVGEGRYLPQMKTLASTLGIAHCVDFTGQLLFGNAILDFLDSTDLFTMPSRAEGLPRALLEAMSRACPCVASGVGGIPELLAPGDLVTPGAPEPLAELILKIAFDSNRLLSMSKRNLETAQRFDPQAVHRERRTFLEAVKRRFTTRLI